MANGLDKLEKFFSVSKRRGKSLHEKALVPRKLSTDCMVDNDLDHHHFPSPSYMHPKSMRMIPREDTWCDHNPQLGLDRGRSQSVPDTKHHRRRSSGLTSSTAHTERKTPKSNLSRTSSITNNRIPETAPQLSKFRFPEDSLFRSIETTHLSTEVSPGSVSAVTRSSSTIGEEKEERNPFERSPKHISLLFNRLELPDVSGTAGNDAAESLLMPSPLISATPGETSELRQRQLSFNAPSPLTQSEPTFSLFPKPSLRKAHTSHIISPPSSDGGEYHTSAVTDQSGPMIDLAASPDFTPQPSPRLTPVADAAVFICERQSLREPWDVKLDEPMLGRRHMLSNSKIPRSRLRKMQSALTLSTVAAKAARENILQEPTIDDIYALSDDDIAEARAETPVPVQASMPPTPPPKDAPEQGVRRRTATLIRTPPSAAINPNSGEFTPPDTPTESHFLTPLPPSSPSGELGAIMAAGIAMKYNFDLVYLVSLWPSGHSNHTDLTRQSPSKLPQRQGASIVATLKSSIAGRYLAAFGLNGTNEPFHIHTNVYLKALASKGWYEARDPKATGDRIDRGWICSFYSENVVNGGSNPSNVPPGNAMNRGIVFAAFTKRSNKSNIPTRSSPEQKEMLDQIHNDAKMLVDTLIEKM